MSDQRKKMASRGLASLFFGNVGHKHELLNREIIHRRNAVNELKVGEEKYLMLENQTVINVPNRCTGLLCAYSCDQNATYKLGVIIFQSMSMTAIANAYIDKKVCFICSFVYMNVQPTSLTLIFYSFLYES